jgi:hypothetical protein
MTILGAMPGVSINKSSVTLEAWVTALRAGAAMMGKRVATLLASQRAIC